MAEGQSPEQIEFLSQLEIQLAVSGVPDVVNAFREIVNYEKEALKNISELKKRFNGFDGAIKDLVDSHRRRGRSAGKASKEELSSQRKLLRGYKKLTYEVDRYSGGLTSAAKALVIPATLGASIKAALDYNKSLIEISSSVNRLGIGFGQLERSLQKISKETTLTRMETIGLFDQYQEDMRFISLNQFQKLMHRIKDIVGANSQAMAKMQKAVSSLSKEYPSLVAGLIDMSDADKDIVRGKVRTLYLLGKIGDAQYKQVSAYISGSRQMTDRDKKILELKQKQIKAANEFKRQWEAVRISIGNQLLPVVQNFAEWLKKVLDYTKDWEITIGKIAAIYATLKVGGMVLPAVVSGVTSGLIAKSAVTAGVGTAAGAAGYVGAGALAPSAVGVGTVAGAGAAGAGGGITIAGLTISGGFALATIATAAASLVLGTVYSGATLGSDKFAQKQAESGKMQWLLDFFPVKALAAAGGAGWKDLEGGDFTKTNKRLEEQKKAIAEGSYVSQAEKNAEDRGKKMIERGIEEGQKKDIEIVKTKGIGVAYGGLGEKKEKTKENIRLAEEGVKAAEANLSAGRKNSKELTRARDILRDEKNELDIINARQENIAGLMALQGPRAEKLQGFYQAQVGEVDALIERMSITGNIDQSKIFESMKAPLKTLRETIDARRTLIKFLEMEDPKASKRAMKEEANNKNRSKEHRKAFRIYADLSDASFVELDRATAVAKERAKITEELREETHLLSKVSGGYDDILKLTRAQATGAGLLVQLGDNYAIGVQASLQTRMKEFSAHGDIIKQLRDRLQGEKTAYQLSIQNNEGVDENNRLKAISQATQNEITQAQISQASGVKAMRDAWVSAISAMNTGMGSFSELIMDAEQNTAQVTQLRGAVRSAASGATGRRDPFGFIVEDVGFRGTERMNVQGQISRRGGGRPSDISYETGRPYGHNTTRVIEALLRGDISEAAFDLSAGANFVGRGGPTTLAAGANRHVLSTMTDSPIISLVLDNLNIVLKWDGVEDLASKVSTAAKKGMGKVLSHTLEQYRYNN